MRKEYAKPQAEISAFITEDVILTSGASAPFALNTNAVKGVNLGEVNGLFSNK